MVKFNTHFSVNIPLQDHKFEAVDHVEREGVVPLRNQIKMFKEAGVLLRATRSLQFDSGSGLDDFEKVDTAYRDARDYADMSELIARANATSKVVDIINQKVPESANLSPSDASKE